MFQHARKALGAAALVAAAALGGATIASATSTGTTGPTGPSSSSSAPHAMRGPAPGMAAHESAEKAVTGAAAAKAQAAAEKAVGGGTAGPVTTDCTGTGYETTVTKPNGSKVEVHLNSSFQVLQGPAGHGGPPGPPPGG
jgi:hypothetical protein